MRAGIAALFLLGALLAVPSQAAAQADFTLLAAPLSPEAVAPGGTSSTAITVGTLNGFTGTVDLTCQVTSQQMTTSPPVCAVSPTTVTPPAGATATITTTGLTSTVGYAITITGTAGSITHSASQNLTVLAVTPQFTITVQTAVAPSSVPAGSGAQGVININPINGYTSPPILSDGTGGVTLACATINPLVTIPPVCSFNPPNVEVNGRVATSTITISTSGPVHTGAVARSGSIYALWLPLPMLALAGVGAATGGKRARKAWGLLALLVMSGALLLMPACASSSSTSSTTTPNGVTPANTYTFTIVGVDSNGVISSNASTTSSNPTVTLTVTTPAN